MYPSFERALARVETLKARPFLGAWPGIVGPCCPHFGCPGPGHGCPEDRAEGHEWYWRLTFDPPDLPTGL